MCSVSLAPLQGPQLAVVARACSGTGYCLSICLAGQDLYPQRAQGLASAGWAKTACAPSPCGPQDRLWCPPVAQVKDSVLLMLWWHWASSSRASADRTILGGAWRGRACQPDTFSTSCRDSKTRAAVWVPGLCCSLLPEFRVSPGADRTNKVMMKVLSAFGSLPALETRDLAVGGSCAG